IVFILVGHKCDLEQQRQVSQQEAEKLAAAYGMRYVETSARDAINVERAFTELTFGKSSRPIWKDGTWRTELWELFKGKKCRNTDPLEQRLI
uniref:small monomeric GTPase n=1 Tax=Sinocyclocheilus anshuiensis TaxID=1608454 RepID=A0A671MXG6_9TELE